MTENEWLAATHPNPLIEFVGEQATPRKLRLFSCACCRRIEPLIEDAEFVHALGCAEQFADGLASETELREVERRAATAFNEKHAPGVGYHSVEAAIIAACEKWYTDFPLLNPRESTKRVVGYARRARVSDPAVCEFPPWPEGEISYPLKSGEIEQHIRAMDEFHDAVEVERARVEATEADPQAALFRDLFGNPFRPVACDPAWLTSDVLALAEGIYAERAFERMPILADALQDAGCDSDEMLNHCRDAAQVHVRGCWVIDLLTGRK